MFLLSQLVPFLLRFSYGFCWKISILHLFVLPAVPLLKETFLSREATEFVPLLPKTSLYLALYTLAGSYALLV